MKKIIKLAKIILIIAVVGLVAVGGYKLITKESKVELPVASEYDKRVEQKMKETAEDWKAKHKVWAEQEVSKEIIAEQEQKLEVLREKELSL